MSILVIRHALSEANNRDNIGKVALAHEQAPLMKLGIDTARNLGRILTKDYCIDTTTTPVAVSEFKRAQQTAIEAGFAVLSTYESLNEVDHKMPLNDEFRRMLDNNELHKAAIDTAWEILSAPPTEEVWFTHGLVIAGLCKVMNVHQDRRLIPRFCEIRELPI